MTLIFWKTTMRPLETGLWRFHLCKPLSFDTSGLHWYGSSTKSLTIANSKLIEDEWNQLSATTGNYQDMNGMKDKFDVALKRIGDEIDKDQAEQNEKNATQWLQITNKDKMYLYTGFFAHLSLPPIVCWVALSFLVVRLFDGSCCHDDVSSFSSISFFGRPPSAREGWNYVI